MIRVPPGVENWICRVSGSSGIPAGFRDACATASSGRLPRWRRRWTARAVFPLARGAGFARGGSYWDSGGDLLVAAGISDAAVPDPGAHAVLNIRSQIITT